ncbi:HTH_Tnp_Tc3_2 domain-containing protein [Trichonephila clavipes]|nr:HTH_Tnp_Tc3_2 domain-containing protein [Trichonephila clavipes]
MFSDESKFYLVASVGRVLFRRRSGERLQLNCLQPRQTGPTPGVMDNTRPLTADVTQRSLQSVDRLPWSERSPVLFPIEQVRDIIS